MKISPRRNPLTYLLIRRASRATFPDMGRLTDSLLPTTEVKTTKQFRFYIFFIFIIMPFIILLLGCHHTATLPLFCLTKSYRILPVR